MARGGCFNHPGALMVDLAEKLTSLISIANWAVFAKNGSDVTTWAIRVAREFTGRKKIITARGAYHGTHAWCTDYPGGVMPAEKNDILKMTWNHTHDLEKLVAAHPEEDIEKTLETADTVFSRVSDIITQNAKRHFTGFR